MQPFILVIFGATGDLVHTKLIPALFSLYKEKGLSEYFYIIGFARRPLTDTSFANLFTEYANDPEWEKFSSHLHYHQGSFDDSATYKSLAEKLIGLDKSAQVNFEKILYLATPPENYNTILEYINHYKYEFTQDHKQLAKLAIEKPFGKDLNTAKMLDQKLSEYFTEWQVFRVDHYLGKETVQNMLVFRFANSIFEPIWNANYIDHIQITFAENKGIQSRGRFFDGVGILRDVAQNHLLQLLAAVAMEQPKSFSREGVRDARAAVIAAIHCYDPSQVDKYVIRGQYEDYLQEKDVTAHSQTETFVALKILLQNERFAGVPFYIRAGKKLSKSLVEVSVVFKQTCHLLFREIGCPEEGNVLTFYIQPDEGIGLKIIAKNPGNKLILGNTKMHFLYNEEFHTTGTDAYQKILLDIFYGDQTLFNRSDELASSWEFITTILHGWEKNASPLYTYQPNTWGPKEAFNLIEKDGRKWIF